MTYLELINKAEAQLKARGHSKSIIFNIIYLTCDDINDLAQLTDKINDEIPNDLLQKMLNALQDYLLYDKPISYSLNGTFFCNQKFIVDKYVLPPRPETEEWTNIVINLLKNYGQLDILDLCCGSGAIGLSIKKALPHNRITLSDVSKMAIANTKKNAEMLNLDVDIVLSNLFEDLANRRYDVIVCNPPYVDVNYPIDNAVSKYEPFNAIYAPNRGLYYYEAIIKNIHKYLKDEYMIVMEIGFNLGWEVKKLFKKYLNAEPEIYVDNNGIERVVLLNRL